MKCTHRLYRWIRDKGAHKYRRGISYRARFKKDGTIMFYKGVHRVCMGPYPPYICYLSINDLMIPKWANHKDSWETLHPYQYYYTIESES